MSVLDIIENRRALARPKSIVDGTPKWEAFEKKKRDLDVLNKFQIIYEQGGPISEAIDCYPLFCLSNGYRLEGDETLIPEIQDSLDNMNIEEIMFAGIRDCVIFGDAFQEKAKGHGELSESVLMVRPLPAKTFRILYNDYGEITGYQQVIKITLTTEEVLEFKPEQILRLSLYQLPGSVYGVSMVGRAFDDIIRDTKTSEGIAVAIQRHGFGKYHVKVGTTGEDVPDEILRRIDMDFRKLKPGNDFVSSYDVLIENIDSGAIGDITSYYAWAISRVSAAMGVPEEILGLGRGSTEATANVRIRAWYDKIASIQKRVARQYNTQLIDMLTGMPGAVKIVFNDPNPEDDAQLADRVAKLTSNPIDPFILISKLEARRMIGLPDEVEGEVIEEESEMMPGEEEPQPEEITGQPGEGTAQEPYIPPMPKGLSSPHDAACKAARTRGDKPGPACGGAEEPSKERPSKASEPTTNKKKESKQDTGKRPSRPKGPLSEHGRERLEFIRSHKEKLGNNKWNDVLGKAGEAVMHDLYDQFHAHVGGNDTEDMENDFLFDVKTLNPNSKGTPIMPNALQRKLDYSRETKKRWAFPVLVPEGDDIILYLDQPSDDFYKLDPKGKGDIYFIDLKNARKMGHFDKNNKWHGEE